MGHAVFTFRGIQEIVDALLNANNLDSELQPYAWEGWVLRQCEEIAKIRNSELRKVEQT